MDDDSDATNSLNPRRASPFVTALALRFPLLGGGIGESDLRIEKLTLVVSKETGDLSPIMRPNIKCIGKGPRHWRMQARVNQELLVDADMWENADEGL
jgi:hypothetical protein